jgi:hypothetical protein
MRRGSACLAILLLGASPIVGPPLLAGELTSSDKRREDTPKATSRLDKTGGGKKKLLLAALPLLGGAGGAAYYLATKNRPPSGGTIGVSDPLALMGVTEIEFRSQGASDPDGDGLSYEWDFGDGSSGSGAVVRHVFASAGTFTVNLRIGDAKRWAPAAPVRVVVKSVAGNWRADHLWEPALALTQAGATLSGSYADKAGAGQLLPGSQLQAPATMVVKIQIASPTVAWKATLTCALDAAMDECLGHFVDDVGGRDYGLFRFQRQ